MPITVMTPSPVCGCAVGSICQTHEPIDAAYSFTCGCTHESRCEDHAAVYSFACGCTHETSCDEHERGSPRRIHPDDVEAIAQRVAELLRGAT